MKGAVIKAVAEFAEVVTGGTPSTTKPEYWDGEVPWLNSGSLNEGVITTPSKYITELGLQNSAAKLMPKDTVLVALTGATTGQVGYLAIEATANQSVTGILPSKEHYPKYLYFFLKSQRKKMLGDAFGGAQPHINQKYVKDFKIPLPRIDDQIRIAHLLGKVEGLTTQRKQHLQLLDDLLKSVFLEMFGDPVRNEKMWEKKPLAKLGSVNRGVSKHRPRNAPELLGGKYPLIQTGDVSNAGTYLTSYSQTYSDIGFAQSKLWPTGTLCITIAANIAQTSILTFDACFPDSVVGFTAFEGEAHVLYIHGLFWFFQKILEKNAPAAAQKNINLEILRTLEVPKPPIELLNQFATIVEKVEAIKSRYQHSLTELEALYGALSQQAFKGELDLSRVPLLGIESVEEKTVVTEHLQDRAEESLAINLPDTDKSLDALENAEARVALIAEWLEAYRGQLGDTPFSVQRFMEMAQTRFTELHPETDFELGANDYEHIKTWVFEALATGTLTQAIDDAGNRIELRKRPNNWGSW